MSGSKTAYYLYCLGPSERLPRITAAGVDERSEVFLWSCGDIGAVLSEVSLKEFCGEAAEARLQDLTWLGPRVGRHETVVEEAMRHSPVLPVRFATLYTSADSLKEFVLQHRATIAEFFSEIRDQQEWAVKGLLVRTRAREAMRSASRLPAETSLPSASPGVRYFQEKRIETGINKQLNLWLKEACQRAAAELQSLAGGFRERKILGQGGAEDGAEAVLNWAFLLPLAGVADFRMRVERLNSEHVSRGLSLWLTGPWPPYSFVPALGGGAQP